jgi:membrane-associated protease RseP (regulator of RpoE activity)
VRTSALAKTCQVTIYYEIPTMRPLLSTILVLSFIRFGAVALGAPPVTPIPPLPKTTPQRTSVPVVVSVDANSITVQNGIHPGGKVTHHDEVEDSKKTDAQKKNATNVRTYTVTRFTEITINGQRCSLSDIKPTMPVRVTAGMDPSQASIIAAKVEGTPQISTSSKAPISSTPSTSPNP